ncbi:MAG: hypothetical protein G8D81_20245 [gamma proteobacterium symbiont of Clathrolucina costata]|uniref:Uncharacterized protein n=1 Tax=Candidatus Thiodiazotropha taylori TaxID=2792791 RepID=A0A9E4NH04_9GAMM|nr:hypothetical protein [Candidatus Thiodiazotropha taylori]MCW4235151.1 hypothetical protein [Candidatus Thiodiazotropha endolucinida]
MAESPEQSEFTSIAERTDKLKQGHVPAKEECNPSGLHPFAGYPPKSIPKGLPFRLKENLELVDWTGRAILEYMRGYIPANQPPILEWLQIDLLRWLYMTQHFESRFKGLVGTSYKLKEACQRLGYHRTSNLGAALRYLA